MKFFRLFIMGCFLCVVMGAYGQNSKVVSELQRKKKAAQELLKETNRMLTSTKRSTQNSLNQLSLLTQEIRTRRQLISVLNQEVAEIEKEQQQLLAHINVLEGDLMTKKEKYGIAMRSLYNSRSGMNEIMFVLSAQTLTHSYRRMRYLHEYAVWRSNQSKEIVAKQQELQNQKVELDKKKDSKQLLLTERRVESETLREKESDQKKIVTELQKKESSLQADLKKQQAEARKIDQQIEKMIQEEARKSVQRKDSKPASQGGYAMNRVETALSGSFEKNKGKLPYPIKGTYMVVGRFGQQQMDGMRFVTINNDGIDLQTKQGAEAISVYDGVVSQVFIVPGSNVWVMIRHGNYISIYSNLSKVYVKAGDQVKTGQSIGQIFSDSENGNLTKMQFQIRKETVKLNPEHWLAR